MEILKKFTDAVNKVVSVFAIILFVILIFACVLQVFFRFVLDSLSWSEEQARFCFIWMHLVGASLLCRSHEHATVTAILDLVKGNLRKVWDIAIEVIILFDGTILLIYGIQLVQGTWGNPSPAMSFNMGIVNAAAPTAGGLLMLQAITMIVTDLCELAGAGKKQAEEG